MAEEIFDKQSFLISYYDDIAEKVKNLKYDYLYVLNTTKDVSLPTTICALTDRLDIDKFTQLKTYQYNSLTPMIRLYRVEYGTDKKIKAEKLFVFNKNAKYSVANMTSPIVTKDNCGIKSINWKLAGSNPVTAEKQVEVEIQFFFDSINAFSGGSYDSMVSAWNNAQQATDPFSLDQFSFCDTETTTKNYWSLLFHPKNDKNTYDTFNFRIKAMIGWEDMDSNIKKQINLSDVDEQIKKLNYTFFLNLVKHQFTLNEDGSLLVTANYIASFESSTLNYQFDILGDLKSQLNSLKNKTLTEVLSGQTLDELVATQGVNALGYTEIRQTLIEVGIGDTGGALESEITSLSVSNLAGLTKFANALTNENTLESLKNCNNLPPEILATLNNAASTDALKKQAETFSKLTDVATKYLERSTQVEIRKFYTSFINELISVDDVSKSRYFAIKVSKNNQKTWTNWYNGITPKPYFNQVATSESSSALDEALQQTSEELQNSISAEDTGLTDSAESKETAEDIKIVFTNFGSVIDTAYRVVEKHIREKDASSPLLDELKRQKTILGNISDENQIFNYNQSSISLGTTSNIKNIAFAPIELGLLKKFLIDNIIKPKKTTYPLFAFLKDALSTLVIASVNSFGGKNNEVDKYANISLGSNLITFGDMGQNEDPLENYLLGSNSIIEASTLTSPQVLNDIYVNYLNINKHKNYYTYYLMYDKTLKDYTPLNDSVKDAEMGVYHYTYGQDYGLVKSINFSKIDQPYLKEAKAVGTKTFYLGQFRDIYNADVTMIGNNIYYPGMMLYLKPSVETSIQVSEDKPNFSQITGIGGYYFVTQIESSITEDSYETKLKTIWHSDGYEKPNSIDEQTQCDALLQEAGLLSDNASEIAILQRINSSSIYTAAFGTGLLGLGFFGL